MSDDNRAKFDELVEKSRNNDALDLFLNVMQELVEGLADTYEACEATQHMKETFEKNYAAAAAEAEKEDDESKQENRRWIIEAWHEIMSPYYESIDMREDGYVLSNLKHPLMDHLGVEGKWRSDTLDAESRDYIWEMLQLLCQHAKTYRAVPKSVLSKLSSIAGDIEQKMKSGSVTAADFQMGNLVGSVLSSMTQEDIMELTQNPMGMMSVLNNLTNEYERDIGGDDEQDSDDPMAKMARNMIGSCRGMMETVGQITQNPEAAENDPQLQQRMQSQISQMMGAMPRQEDLDGANLPPQMQQQMQQLMGMSTSMLNPNNTPGGGPLESFGAMDQQQQMFMQMMQMMPGAAGGGNALQLPFPLPPMNPEDGGGGNSDNLLSFPPPPPPQNDQQ